MFSKIKYHFQTKHVTLPGNIDICYMDEGAGEETILFVHGLASYGNVWFQQLEALQKYYRCIAVDLPGCGQSSRGDYPYSMLFYSEIIVKFCQMLQLNEIVLCGHSMGGHACIITALRNPPLVKRLALIAPSGFEKFTQYEISMYKGMISFGNFFFSNKMQLTGSLQQSFYKMTDGGQKMIDQLVEILNEDDITAWRAMVDKCINGMLNEQVFDMLKFIQCPVLAIFGSRDALIPNIYFHHTTVSYIAETACNEIHNAQLLMIPDAGHAVFMERPDQVNEAIRVFGKT